MQFITNRKIVPLEELAAKARLQEVNLTELFLSNSTEKIISEGLAIRSGLTNGVFDVLHLGHIYSLNFARMHCGHLMVLVNSDRAVKLLKGDSRPFQDQDTRMAAVAALECVDSVALLDDTRITGALEKIRPQVWFKGGDYTLETLDQDERKMAEQRGVAIEFIPALEGYSSTRILEQGMQNT